MIDTSGHDVESVKLELKSTQSDKSNFTLGQLALLMPLILTPTVQGIPVNSTYTDQNDSSNRSEVVSEEISDLVIIALLNKIQNSLISNQKDIDQHCRKILYDNLSELYV